MFTFEQLRPSLLKWGGFYSSKYHDMWDLVGEAWCDKRVRDLENIKIASIAVRRSLIDFFKKDSHYVQRQRLIKQGKKPASITNLTSIKSENRPDLFVKVKILPDINYDDKECVETLLESLTPKDRQVIRLKYYEGLSFRRIGKLLNLSGSAIEWRHKRALKRLRAKLNNQGLK